MTAQRQETNGKRRRLAFIALLPGIAAAGLKADPGVVPNDDICEKSGIQVVQTGYQHTDMSDRGPDTVKNTIQGMLDKFLDDDSPLKPVESNTPKITEPGPVALYAPVKN